MAEDFLTPIGTCHLFPRWHSFKGFALTLIGSNGSKSLCSTLPKNPDLGFQSKVIPFSRSNHHVTKYGCFHLAQSRQRWCTFDGNSHGICSNTPAVFDRIRSNSPNSSNYQSIIQSINHKENSFKKEETSNTSHITRQFRFSRYSRRFARSCECTRRLPKINARLRSLPKISDWARFASPRTQPALEIRIFKRILEPFPRRYFIGSFMLRVCLSSLHLCESPLPNFLLCRSSGVVQTIHEPFHCNEVEPLRESKII